MAGGAKRVDPATGAWTELPAPEGPQVDGIILMDDGSYIASSWSLRAVVRVAADGEITPVLRDVEQAADIGYDALRHRVLIPTFQNELHIVSLGGR